MGSCSLSWTFCPGSEALPAESCHCERNNKLQPPWSYPVCYGEVGLGWMSLQNVPFPLESLAVWWNILITSPFWFRGYIWLSVGRSWIFEKSQHSGCAWEMALTGSSSGFNSWCITAQVWPILSWILDL